MNPIEVTIFPNGNGWCGVTTFEDGSLEKRSFANYINAQWYMENMLERMRIKNAV